MQPTDQSQPGTERGPWTWRRARLSSGRVLRVWAPSSEPGWLDIAVRHASGGLPGLERVRSASTSVVFRGNLPGFAGTFYLKRLLARGWRDRVTRLLRASRAMREWRGSQLAAAAGIGVARVRCVIEERAWGVTVASAVVTDAVEHARTLRSALCPEEVAMLPDLVERRELLLGFARDVGAWHRAGLCHGDMHVANVLCRREAGVWRFWWLDHENTRRDRSLRGRTKNLTEINRKEHLPTTERMRFWRAYVEAAGISADERRVLLDETIRRTFLRWRHVGYRHPSARQDSAGG